MYSYRGSHWDIYDNIFNAFGSTCLERGLNVGVPDTVFVDLGVSG